MQSIVTAAWSPKTSSQFMNGGFGSSQQGVSWREDVHVQLNRRGEQEAVVPAGRFSPFTWDAVGVARSVQAAPASGP